MKTPLIEFRNVHKRYGNKIVLNGVNLKVYPSEVTTIIGKSGVGKSVTLKLMIGLDKPDRGDILYRGHSIHNMPKSKWKELKKEINFMFQNNALFDSMTIYENIALPLVETTNMSDKEIKKRVLDVMETLDIAGQENKYPSQLSGGMQKRVALARAVVTDPKVVLFDEPTTGLDPIRRNSVLEMILRKQREFGFTAVLVSHDVPHVFYISSRIAVIDDGKIIFEGTPMELENCAHPVVHEFINSLEFLKNDVAGMMTSRDFEKFFEKIRREKARKISFILYEIDRYNDLIEKVGYITPYNIVCEIASTCRESCGSAIVAMGKYGIDKVVSVVNETDPEKIKTHLKVIGNNLKHREFMHSDSYTESCVEFAIYAGYTIVDNEKSLKQLIDEAKENRILLAKLLCGKK